MCIPKSSQTADILPFVPKMVEVDQEKDHRLETVGTILADACSMQAAATALMQMEPWDFTAVYFDSIDHFSHAFMHYYPPRREGIPEKD